MDDEDVDGDVRWRIKALMLWWNGEEDVATGRG